MASSGHPRSDWCDRRKLASFQGLSITSGRATESRKPSSPLFGAPIVTFCLGCGLRTRVPDLQCWSVVGRTSWRGPPSKCLARSQAHSPTSKRARCARTCVAQLGYRSARAVAAGDPGVPRVRRGWKRRRGSSQGLRLSCARAPLAARRMDPLALALTHAQPHVTHAATRTHARAATPSSALGVSAAFWPPRPNSCRGGAPIASQNLVDASDKVGVISRSRACQSRCRRAETQKMRS